MRRTTPIVIAALLALSTPALARAPKLADLPTVKMVTEQADLIIEEDRARELAEQQDPKIDLIDDYSGRNVNYWQFARVTDILTEDKEDMKYRRHAADALLHRFDEEDAWDPNVKKVKVKIGSALVKELHDTKLEIRVLVAQIFEKYWPGQYSRFGYDPEETAFAKRNRAVKRWREYLGGK